MSALTKSIERERAFALSVRESVGSLKQSDLEAAISPSGPLRGMKQGRQQSANKLRYSLFRGWVYAAIHAIASEGATQEPNVGRRVGVPDQGKRSPSRTKSLRDLPRHVKRMAGRGELEVDNEHLLALALDDPNPVQDPLAFVYTFIANLCLTGWGYVVGGETGEPERPIELYAIPTTWIVPVHDGGPFSSFLLIDPDDPTTKPLPLERENVAFAHLPNPADPREAIAPAGAQIQAIRIDDHIQTSQEALYENGIWPSVIVEIGKDPHPDVSAGVRPRLTGSQRRQVIGTIRKALGGVQNYGNPAIVDGLIENIRPLSLTSREMGWDKSEDKVRTRILSSFGVHPYILGEAVSVGGYAQAAKIEERFCKRVNLFLGMLGRVVTQIGAKLTGDPVVVWWDECEPHDPDLFWRNILTSRKNGDVTRNEVRALLGLSDLEADEEENRNKLLDSVGGMGQAAALVQMVGQGQVSPEAAARLLSLFLEIPVEEAALIVGSPEPAVADQLQRLVDAMREPVRIERLPAPERRSEGYPGA